MCKNKPFCMSLFTSNCIRWSITLQVSIRSNQMMSFEWAKPVATELLVIRMSKPFAAKPAANWVMKKCFYMALIKYRRAFRPNFGPRPYTVN